MSGIRIFACPFTPHLTDVEGNALRMVEELRAAREKNCDLVIFPETALTGYCLGDLHTDPELVRRQERVIEEVLAPACLHIAAVIGATCELRDGDDALVARHNSAVVLAGGRVIHRAYKVLLANEGVLEDSRYFDAGPADRLSPVDVPLAGGRTLRLGVLICQDLWDDGESVHPARQLTEMGARLLCVINASPFHLRKPDLRRTVAANRVAECGVPLVYVNATSLEDVGKNLVLFDGHCFAMSAAGLVQTRPWDGRSVVWDVPLDPVSGPFPAPQVRPEALLAEALIYGIREFFQKSRGAPNAVIGLSGGIDSAVDALLVTRALGADRLTCVNLPTRFNSPLTRDLAGRIAANLGVNYRIHPIEDVITAHAARFAESLGRPVKTLTLENIQARERGNILMAYAQELGAMVVGNGNKTEFQRGYATLYGDLIGALMPLGDVHKLLVYALGRELDPHGEILPPEVFTVVPSAELSENQNVLEGRGDPFDYHIEAPLGVELIENRATPAALRQAFEARSLDSSLWIPDAQGRTVYDKMTPETFEDAARDVREAIARSFFKRVQSPPNIVVSPRAFGLDLHETLLGG
ncbi:NAD(+) synthase [Myxococcota bacterium]|nr:NAD(+) synthase [Myxococcota bacterium]